MGASSDHNHHQSKEYTGMSQREATGAGLSLGTKVLLCYGAFTLFQKAQTYTKADWIRLYEDLFTNVDVRQNVELLAMPIIMAIVGLLVMDKIRSKLRAKIELDER